MLGHLQARLGALVSRDPEAIQSAVTRSIEIKADIVSRDEREQGDRLYLNYGHTFAHAIEFVRGVTADEETLEAVLGDLAGR